jgi:hypothetical protein
MFLTVRIGSITNPTHSDRANFTIRNTRSAMSHPNTNTHQPLYVREALLGKNRVNVLQPGAIPQKIYPKIAY